jgi:hypothetical protein
MRPFKITDKLANVQLTRIKILNLVPVKIRLADELASVDLIGTKF